MRIVKALFGGAIGGLLGAAVWLWIEMAISRSMPIGVLLAGVGAGLGVRLFCGKEANLLTGILAALMSLVGIIGASYGSSALASARQVEFKLPDSATVSQVDEVEITEDTEDTADTETDEAMVTEEEDSEPTDDPSADTETSDATDDDATSDEADDDATEDDADPATSDDTESETTDLSEEAVQALNERGKSYHSTPDDLAMEDYPQYKRKTDWSLSEIAFNGLSALIAFVLGAGSFQTKNTDAEKAG